MNERVKSAPFAIVAPFAEQTCDSVKHDSRLPLLSSSPGLEITGKQDQN